MKKIAGLLSAAVAVLSLNGCGGGGDSYNDGLSALFLVDEENFSYDGIPYKCDSMSSWSSTSNSGEFLFYPGETCTFDFDDLNGIYYDEFDDIVRIVDAWDGLNEGKEDIYYECTSYGEDITDIDGSFVYDANDVCTFWF